VDGWPLVAPVWFVVEDGVLLFNTGKETAKGRAIRRDPRLVLCVDLEEPPYAFVQVQGTATVSEDPDELVRSAKLRTGRDMFLTSCSPRSSKPNPCSDWICSCTEAETQMPSGSARASSRAATFTPVP